MNENALSKLFKYIESNKVSWEMSQFGPICVLKNKLDPFQLNSFIHILSQMFPIVQIPLDNNKSLNKKPFPFTLFRIHGIELILKVCDSESFISKLPSKHLRYNARKTLSTSVKKHIKFAVTRDQNLIEEWYFHLFLPKIIQLRADPFGFSNYLFFMKYLLKVKPLLAYAHQEQLILGGMLLEKVESEREIFYRIKCIASTKSINYFPINDFITLNLVKWAFQNNLQLLSFGIDPAFMTSQYLGVYCWKNKWNPSIKAHSLANGLYTLILNPKLLSLYKETKLIFGLADNMSLQVHIFVPSLTSINALLQLLKKITNESLTQYWLYLSPTPKSFGNKERHEIITQLSSFGNEKKFKVIYIA